MRRSRDREKWRFDRDFCVNDNMDGICCWEFDSVDLVVGSGERCRERLGESWDEGLGVI